MKNGERLMRPSLRQIKERHRVETGRMPKEIFALKDFAQFPVELSGALRELQEETAEKARGADSDDSSLGSGSERDAGS